MKEGGIQALIMIAMQQQWPQALIKRVNTGAMKDTSGRLVRFGTPGQADIEMILDGRHIEVEVKRPGKKQSKRQVKYQQILERSGGIYVVATSPEQAIEAINDRLRQD